MSHLFMNNFDSQAAAAQAAAAQQQDKKSGTTICPICATHLSYPLGSVCILCPVCSNSLSPPPSATPAATPAAPAPILNNPSLYAGGGGMGGSTPQARCVGCKSLLAYPPNAVYIQCPSCFQTMATQPTSNTVYMGQQQAIQPPPSKKRKDPNAPKAVTNAYMIFCKSRRAELKAKHPELAFGKIGARLGEMWRTMSAEEKKPYELKATQDRERYRHEMLRYQAGKMLSSDPDTKKARTEGDDDNANNTTENADGSAPTETQTKTEGEEEHEGDEENEDGEE